MIVYYGGVQGRPDVSFEAPVDEPMATVLSVYQNLDPKKGFLALVLSDRLTIQMLAQTNGRLRVELLDSNRPGVDEAAADRTFGVELIEAVARGEDGFHLAKKTLSDWRWIDFS